MIFDDIPGVRNICHFVPGFRPDGLRRWRIFHLEASHTDSDSDYQPVDLTIQAEYSWDSHEQYVIEMIMQGVRELRLPDMRGWFGFDSYVIQDVRSHQWEGVSYRVAECEEGRRFLCLCRAVAFTKLIITGRHGPDQVIWEANDSPLLSSDQ